MFFSSLLYTRVAFLGERRCIIFEIKLKSEDAHLPAQCNIRRHMNKQSQVAIEKGTVAIANVRTV